MGPDWGFIYTCGEPANATRRVLICSKQAGSTDYYVPSCGLADGQIIGAEIVYDQAHAQVKAQEEQQCRDELVKIRLRCSFGSNTSETEQIGTDADNIPPAPEQIAAEAERKRQEEAAAEAERRQESEGEVKTEAERRQESEGEAAAMQTGARKLEVHRSQTAAQTMWAHPKGQT